MRQLLQRSTLRKLGVLVIGIQIITVISIFILLGKNSNSDLTTPCASKNYSTPPEVKNYEFTIIVFTYARPDGLAVTLESILNADYSKALGSRIELEIFVDYRRHDNGDLKQKQATTMELLSKISWPYGRLRIHRRVINAGLRHSIMESWYPTSDREVAAFFEDDVEVSPYWFAWTHDALMRYAPIENGAIRVDPHFIGISLFRPIHDELSKRDVVVENDNAPFLLQQPCSWGAVYFPQPWRRFRDFFDEKKGDDILVKLEGSKRVPSSNYWDYATSWKKYIIYYMYVNGLYMLYPNFPDTYVLSTSRMLPGEHRLPQKSKFVLPLLKETSMSNERVKRSVYNLPQMNELKTYDVMFQAVADIQALPNYRS